MKILESSPGRYDVGIRLMTLGRLDRAYDRLVSNVKSGQHVLDIGCGTGALSLRAAKKGAKVKGIDINPQMLGIAQERVDDAEFSQIVNLVEMGVAELGKEKAENYDVVMSGLCFSELSEDEALYTLKEIRRILKPGGIFLIADESRPEGFLARLLIRLVRFPLVVITYLVTQATTRAVKNLQDKVTAAGFQVKSARYNSTRSFLELVARNPGNSPT